MAACAGALDAVAGDRVPYCDDAGGGSLRCTICAERARWIKAAVEGNAGGDDAVSYLSYAGKCGARPAGNLESSRASGCSHGARRGQSGDGCFGADTLASDARDWALDFS